MGIYALIAIGAGAALGAWLRWGFGLMLNSIFPAISLGTLTANLIGCYFIGIATQYFLHNLTIPPEARLFIITGFLGGLTTFSTFSAETVTLIVREQYSWAFTIISAHLFGSLMMTVLGMLTIRLIVHN